MQNRPHVAADSKTSHSPAAPGTPSNADLLLPYLAPYAAYVGIAALAAGLSPEVDYSIRIVVTALLLVVLWKRYPPLSGPGSVHRSVIVGAVAGLAGVMLWIALILPFQDPQAGESFTGSAFALRLVAAALIVPLVEEILFRGYVHGLVTQWQEARRSGAAEPTGVALDGRSVHTLAPGAWTPLAVIVSSAAFALGHAPTQWLAAFGYGLLMSGLWITRRDLVAPVTAHAVTNLVLYIYILQSGSWGLW